MNKHKRRRPHRIYATVRRIHARFLKARDMLEKVVQSSVADLLEQRETKERTGTKGNFAARSFDGLLQVTLEQEYYVTLDERTQEAKRLMLGYVDSILDRVGKADAAALRTIVSEAFRENARGFLHEARVTALVRMQIDDPNWRQARQLLLDAMTPVKGKRYLRCFQRDSREQKTFRQICLDSADFEI